MRLALPRNEFLAMLERQLGNLLAYDQKTERPALEAGVAEALKRTERCFSFCVNKYYFRDNESFFDPFHTGQYCVFLYYLSNSLWKLGSPLAARVYYLNKIFNCVDIYHEVELPEAFGLDHPVGAVIGKATYGEFFLFTQNCNVGVNKNAYPVIGRNVHLFPGSAIVGNCHVGDNCVIAARTYIKDQDIPANSLVFGSSPNLVIKTKSEEHIRSRFGGWWRERT